MKTAAPLIIATLVATAAAIFPAFFSSQFVRPPRADALAIIEAAADYNVSVQNAYSGGKVVPPMSEAVKTAHIGFIETKPCGESDASRDCVALEGRLRLEDTWHDADVKLESYAEITPENPTPKIVDLDVLRSSSAAELARLQIVASHTKLDIIPSSGLEIADVRRRISLRGDTRPDHKWVFSAPWVVGDIAFVQLGFSCGGECGHGENYALRKTAGKWRVIAIQQSWIS